MNTKKITLTIVFAALTVALNPAISRIGFPAPYAPFLIYGLWEIPIVVAFLLIGPKSGVVIAILNSLTLFAVFQGALPAGPFYNLIAIMTMLAGVYLAGKLFARGVSQENHAAIVITAATGLAIVFRVIAMTIVNYVTLTQSYPFGFNYTEMAVLAFLPLGAIFNATTVLYTVPIAYIITRTVKKSVRVNLD